MLAMSLISLAVGTVAARYHRQSLAITEFKQRDVYIYAEYDGPESLRWLLTGSGILIRPMQAQVLIRPAGKDSVRCFGMVQEPELIGETLRALQSELNSRLGLKSFVLVIPPQKLPDRVFKPLSKLHFGDSDSRLHFVETPCGIENSCAPESSPLGRAAPLETRSAS
jgi:hypothetical protein